MMWSESGVISSANYLQSARSQSRLGDTQKKILLVSAFVALSSGAAFAGGGNFNNAFVGQAGFFNAAVVEQGGVHNFNSAFVGQLGAGNESGIAQSGYHNFNHASTLQFGVGNGAIISQD